MTDKPKLNTRQVLLMRALLKGKTLGEAAIEAGYSDENPAQSGFQALRSVKAKMPELLDRKGLTEDSVIDRYLIPALDAEETKFFQKDGFVTDSRDVIAWSPRLSALDMYFNLRGSYPASGKNGNGHPVNIQINTNVTVPTP